MTSIVEFQFDVVSAVRTLIARFPEEALVLPLKETLKETLKEPQIQHKEIVKNLALILLKYENWYLRMSIVHLFRPILLIIVQQVIDTVTRCSHAEEHMDTLEATSISLSYLLHILPQSLGYTYLLCYLYPNYLSSVLCYLYPNYLCSILFIS